MSVNKVFLVGNLGRDPELRYMPNGRGVCNMTLATSENYKDKDGNKNETTEWHNLVVFGNNAENCANMLKKGSTIAVTGKIKTRKWQDRDGNTRYTTEIDCAEVDFIKGLRERGDSSPREPGGDDVGDDEELPFNPDDDIPF